MDSIHPPIDESTLKSDLLQIQPDTPPRQLSAFALSAIDAAINAGDSEAEARERFAKVAETPGELDGMLASWSFWRGAASR